MQRPAALCVLLAAFVALFLMPVAAQAQMVSAGTAQGYSIRTVSVTSWVEEWDPASQSWVRVAERGDEDAALPVVETSVRAGSEKTAARLATPIAAPVIAAPVIAAAPRAHTPLASYGPFLVLDHDRAALMGSTDSASPRAFDAMLRDFPGLRVLEMIEAPGATNDIANLALGRRIRTAGLATHVPRWGSVRSGAVELFLAGAERTFEEGAQFAVHSWLDTHGRQPQDFASDAPANRLYLDYYVEMGMSESRAQAFYAMTNSVPHHSARWFGADEMRQWLRPERTAPTTLALDRRARVIERAPLAWIALGKAPLAPLTQPPAVPAIDQPQIRQATAPAPTFAPALSAEGQPRLQYADLATLSFARLDS
ncbi:MAG: hypothetical protein AAFR88_00115 [Pseudomonadota bacterium]